MKLPSKTSANSKPAGPFRRMGACLVVLLLLSITFGKLWAASEPQEAGQSEGFGGPGGQ